MAGQPASSAAKGSRWYRPAYGFHPHPPAFHHRFGAKLLGGTMFFWIFYRAYHDGPVLLVSSLANGNGNVGWQIGSSSLL
jgi:NADH dehydrogenase 1 beta subcomplex subunit 2